MAHIFISYSKLDKDFAWKLADDLVAQGFDIWIDREIEPSADWKITIETKTQKPWTCLIDGVQCSTFATLGKGNLVVKDSPENDILVHAQKGNRVLRLRMSQTAWAICNNAVDLERAARRVMRTPIDALWDMID